MQGHLLAHLTGADQVQRDPLRPPKDTHVGLGPLREKDLPPHSPSPPKDLHCCPKAAAGILWAAPVVWTADARTSTWKGPQMGDPCGP